MRNIAFPCAAFALWLVFGAGMALAASHHHRHSAHHAAPIERVNPDIGDLFPQFKRHPALTLNPESGPHRFMAE